jgi:hypothetical protein
MPRTPKYYKSSNCDCQGTGCERCTCGDCGEWLESSEHDVCDKCLDKWYDENN